MTVTTPVGTSAVSPSDQFTYVAVPSGAELVFTQVDCAEAAALLQRSGNSSSDSISKLG